MHGKKTIFYLMLIESEKYHFYCLIVQTIYQYPHKYVLPRASQNLVSTPDNATTFTI